MVGNPARSRRVETKWLKLNFNPSHSMKRIFEVAQMQNKNQDSSVSSLAMKGVRTLLLSVLLTILLKSKNAILVLLLQKNPK